LVGCQCHACRYHTKAYIHHLLKSKELTAYVLLYQHNQYQLLRKKAQAGSALSHDSFDSWKSSILK
jgi:queuine tRNA-ribosyltransferase